MSLFESHVYVCGFRHMAMSLFENHVHGCDFCSRVLVPPVLPVARRLGVPRAIYMNFE